MLEQKIPAHARRLLPPTHSWPWQADTHTLTLHLSLFFNLAFSLKDVINPRLKDDHCSASRSVVTRGRVSGTVFALKFGLEGLTQPVVPRRRVLA